MKKFFEKLKMFFKNNKKLCTWLMASVLALTTLGTGIGLVIHNNVNWGGVLSQIENPQDEKDTQSMASGYWNDLTITESPTGGGTATNPYLIKNAAQLARVAVYVTNKTLGYESAYFKLTKDIDLSEHYWVPIGSSNTSFTGVFDGDGHIIKGLTIDATSGTWTNYTANPTLFYIGLFGKASACTIRNIFLQNPNVNVDLSSLAVNIPIYVGTVVANPNTCKISNCHVLDGSIVFKRQANALPAYVGGIAGFTYGGSISNCSVVASLDVSDASCCGGICGQLSTNSEISDCYYSMPKYNGKISITNVSYTYSSYAGLIVGYCTNANIYRCYSDSTGASVTYVIDFGGIVGNMSGGETVSCLGRNGNFTDKSKVSHFGAVVGIVQNSAVVVSCTFEMFSDVDGTMGCGNSTSGYDKTDSNGYYGAATTPLEPSFYTGVSWLGRGNGTPWDLDGVWYLDNSLPISSRSLPILRTQCPDVTLNYVAEDSSQTNYFNAKNIVEAGPSNQVRIFSGNQVGFSLPGGSLVRFSVSAYDREKKNVLDSFYSTSSISQGQFLYISFEPWGEMGFLDIYFQTAPDSHAVSGNFQILYSTKDLLYWKAYTLTLYVVSYSSNYCVLSFISIIQSNDKTLTTNSAQMSYVKGSSTLPTPSREGYTFGGWYKKKNYLSEMVMDKFMNDLNAQKSSDSPPKMQKNGNIYAWTQSTAYTDSHYANYYYWYSGIYLTGTYRLSYYAYSDGAEVYDYPTTDITINDESPGGVDSSTWQKYSVDITFNNEEMVITLGNYDEDYLTYFKDIYLERIDADDFEGSALKSGTNDPAFGSNTTGTLYAVWYEIIYNFQVVFDAANSVAGVSSWTDAPDSVRIDILGTGLGTGSTIITRGQTWQKSIGYSYFTSTYTIQASVTSSSHEYYISFNSKPTTDSASSVVQKVWDQRTNLALTLYVYQKYTITFDKGYADSGTVPDPIDKVHGTDVSLPENNLIHTGFMRNGWNTNAEGTGTSYTTTFSENANTRLYTNWTPGNSAIKVSIITLDRNGDTISQVGGTITANFYEANENQAVLKSLKSSSNSLVLNALFQREITITLEKLYSGFAFLGFNRNGKIPEISSAPNTTLTFTTSSPTPEFAVAYFKQVSDNQLKYDNDEQYWYFEDGMYPQSEVDTSLAITLENQGFSAASYTLQYNNGTEQEVNVYNYQEQDYARATVNGISKWFVVEPIRWRVSEYGVSADAKPELWQNYGDTAQLVAVSEKILFASIMTADRIDDSEPTDSANFWLNNYVTTLDLTYSGEFSHNQDSFAGAGGQDVSQSGTVSTNVAVYSNNDSTLSSSAKLTAFASFLLYGTTAYADTYDTYWTRDLDTTDGRSEYGCGVVVTSYGSETLRWLNQMYGVRLSYYCTEVSRY